MSEKPRIAEKDPTDAGGNAFPAWFPAWPLPPGPMAAGAARSIVRDVFGEFDIPPDVVDDAQLIISELAANAIVHGDRERAEVWAYVRGWNDPQIVFKVFDSAPWRGPADLPWSPAEPSDAPGGRGLTLVSALTAALGGHWGVHPTRCRLGARPISGKAVFFTVPLPEGRLPDAASRPVWSPHERICALAAARGLRPRVVAGHEMTVVVRFAAGPSVWVSEDSLSYCAGPGRGAVRYPVSDVVEVVEEIVRHCEDLAATGSAPRSPSWDFG